MKLYDYKFMEVAKPLIEHEEFQKMKYIKHHNNSVYDHVLSVAYQSYLISYKLGFDWQSTIRGALLHDFFLYRFERYFGIKLFIDIYKHVKNHPIVALENAEKYFVLNEVEKDIIKKHMFPCRIPKYKESWVVSFVDKYLAIYEYGKNFTKFVINKYKESYNIIEDTNIN